MWLEIKLLINEKFERKLFTIPGINHKLIIYNEKLCCCSWCTLKATSIDSLRILIAPDFVSVTMASAINVMYQLHVSVTRRIFNAPYMEKWIMEDTHISASECSSVVFKMLDCNILLSKAAFCLDLCVFSRFRSMKL